MSAAAPPSAINTDITWHVIGGMTHQKLRDVTVCWQKRWSLQWWHVNMQYGSDIAWSVHEVRHRRWQDPSLRCQFPTQADGSVSGMAMLGTLDCLLFSSMMFNEGVSAVGGLKAWKSWVLGGKPIICFKVFECKMHPYHPVAKTWVLCWTRRALIPPSKGSPVGPGQVMWFLNGSRRKTSWHA